MLTSFHDFADVLGDLTFLIDVKGGLPLKWHVTQISLTRSASLYGTISLVIFVH